MAENESSGREILMGPGHRQSWRPLIPAAVIGLSLFISSGIAYLANRTDAAGICVFAACTGPFGLVFVALSWRLTVGRRTIVETSTALQHCWGSKVLRQVAWSNL